MSFKLNVYRTLVLLTLCASLACNGSLLSPEVDRTDSAMGDIVEFVKGPATTHSAVCTAAPDPALQGSTVTVTASSLRRSYSYEVHVLFGIQNPAPSSEQVLSVNSDGSKYAQLSLAAADVGDALVGFYTVHHKHGLTLVASCAFSVFAAESCGNGLCAESESCASCAADCGDCQPVCGDGVCDADEDCSSCAGDCGTCPPVCGDGTCDADEDCTSCAIDCGSCPPFCGDGTCSLSEDCGSCSIDCGTCDTQAPIVAISSPSDASQYTAPATILMTAAASDNVAIALVEFYLDGVLVGNDDSPPYTTEWQLGSADNGSHVWLARAFDSSGNGSDSAVVTLEVAITGSGACTISTDSSTAGTREIAIHVDCGAGNFFKLSESADFKESIQTGVEVTIESVAADKTYADISVRYPGATEEDPGTPFEVATPKDYRVLTVLFVFDDDTGASAGQPAYFTPTWADRFVYGETVSYDGRSRPNSFKKYVEQISYGSLNVTGFVYPEIIHISLEDRRAFLDPEKANKPTHEMVADAINATNPEFFSAQGQFDLMFFLSPDVTLSGGLYWTPEDLVRTYTRSTGAPLTKYNDYYVNAYNYGLPVDGSTLHTQRIVDEARWSTDSTTVITRYGPVSSSLIEGVWLASDPDHSGVNYFSGGSRESHRAGRYHYPFVRLGTPLPEPNSKVLVTYTPANARYVGREVNYMPADSMNFRSSQRFLHELLHMIPDSTFGFNREHKRGYPDFHYTPPSYVGRYGIMQAEGVSYSTDPDTGIKYQEAPLLKGYLQHYSGFMKPQTLTHGKNAINLRLYKREEGDLTGTTSRIKAIRVPLHPNGDWGTWLGYSESRDTEVQRWGEEYLLLEWRYSGELENNAHNFDQSIPAGLTISHITDRSMWRPIMRAKVKMIDATPPVSEVTGLVLEEGFSESDSSPITFGEASGVYRYVVADEWLQKRGQSTTQPFLLSSGAGIKTLYAKFRNAEGEIVGVSEIEINLEGDDVPSDRLPSVDILNLQEGDLLAERRVLQVDIGGLNGLMRTIVRLDDVDYREVTVDTIDAEPPYISIAPTLFSSGQHEIEIVIYDRAGYRASMTRTFYTP